MHDDGDEDPLDIDLAETSRPQRQFRENRRQAKKISGRKRLHEKEDAILTRELGPTGAVSLD